MAIHLSEDLEQIVNEAVQAGLYARQDDVLRDVLTRLRQSMDAPIGSGPSSHGIAAVREKDAEEAFLQHLLAVGVMSELPDHAADVDDPDDSPFDIQGEPLSETVIRERR